MRLWDFVSLRELTTLRAKRHIGGVYAVAFSPDGKTLVTGGEDKTFTLWDSASYQELATLRGGWVSAVAFSPDGRTLASGNSEGLVKLWDVTLHQELATLKFHAQNVSAIAFSPDGRTLVTSSEDFTVRLCLGQRMRRLLLNRSSFSLRENLRVLRVVSYFAVFLCGFCAFA